MITNILNQSFVDFASQAKPGVTIEEKAVVPPQKQRLDLLADYYTNRVSANETQLIEQYAAKLVSGGKPHTPDPRLYMRRDLLSLVQDSYALGIADALVDLEDVQFASKKTDAEFAVSPDDKLQRDIEKLQRDIQASQNIVRQTKTLDQYTRTLQTLQNQAQTLNNTQATQTLGQLSQQLDAIKTDSTVKATTRLVNQQLDKGQKPYDRLMEKLEQEKYDVEESRKEDPLYDDNGRLIKQRPITIGDYATPQEYLVKRAIEEKLQYLQNRKTSLSDTPPVMLDEDKDFFRWYAEKRIVPIANRYQISLEDKNEEAKKIVTDYTQKINNNTISQASKGEYTDRVIKKLLNIEDKVEDNVNEEEKKANKFNGSKQERFKRDQKPIKRVQRVVATELAIAYNVGRLKAYMKAGIQYVTISTSMYSTSPCKYCIDTEEKTQDNPISIASLLKRAYKNEGFDKSLNRPLESRYLVSHPYCFVNGTMVTMYDILKGKQYQKNISEIVVGDYVKVPTKNKYQKVVQTHKNHYGEYLYKIRTNTGQTITTTGNHPLWDGTDWREAQYFNVGDNLFTHSFSNNPENARGIRVQQKYKKCNNTIITNESEQQIRNDGTESTRYTQNTQGDVNRKEQNQHQFKTTQFRSDESQQPVETSRFKKEDVSCNYREDATTTPLQQIKQTSEWQGNSLQKWVQRDSGTFCKKWLGIQRRINSSKVRLKVRVRESIAVTRWQNLLTRFLSCGLGCIHRSERLLDKRGQGKIQPLHRTVPRDQDGFTRQQELPTTDQSFQRLNRVCIESIEKFIEPQFVYNISVIDDNMYFANGILSHNCMCYYKAHPRRDPEDKQESQGIYGDPDTWKFLLGAGLGVSLVFLAFALTSGRKISVPSTIPIVPPKINLPVSTRVATPETIPVDMPLPINQQLPAARTTIRPDRRVQLPDFRNFLPNLARVVPISDEQFVFLDQQFTSIFRDPDLQPAEKLLEIQRIATDNIPRFAERIADLTKTTARRAGIAKAMYFKRYDDLIKKVESNNIQSILEKQSLRVSDYVDSVEANSVINITTRYERDIDKQIALTRDLVQDLISSYQRVNGKQVLRSADELYMQELSNRIYRLRDVLLDLTENKNNLVNIRSSIRVVNKPLLKQQIANTQSIVDRLYKDKSVLLEAKEQYDELLKMLLTLSPKESIKYKKVQDDLNRRIKNAQGINLKRFGGNIVSFSKYNL